tara:strand:+ start:790 stop:1380 length:591 start_codon:yes stop_codon:yes gene_type:complete
MSFRIEQKILINKNQSIDLKIFLKKRSANEIYPKRIVKSLYFENTTNQMFVDSEEGIVPRKKIRIRYYPETESKFSIEKKISSIEGRFKVNKNIDKKLFDKYTQSGILDNQYGWCKPKIWVEYFREYFEINDVRVTYDTDIKYLDTNGNLIGKEKNSVFEIKTSIKKNLDELIIDFPYDRSRFSKYCNGINLFYKN